MQVPPDNMRLTRLHREIRSCTRCVDAGYLPAAAPVLSGYADNRIMMIGQAPGAVEAEHRVPFQGRSRNVIMRWLMVAGFASEEDARRNIYMTSITKCFPGKGTGGGDRRPGRAEVELCRPHLDHQLALIKPSLLILVGGLSHERFLPGRPLDALVGRVFDGAGREVRGRSTARPLLVPLPHPSGASRWLNAPENRALLDRALRRLRPLVRALLDRPLAGAYTSGQYAGGSRGGPR
ncbi:MAG TPA: uracil-DNA glycosylase family protein [Candidatus Angelobacter sp.]|jgi:uracil-DNA glycosylase|nr:uracil-DNA glycosylase family protein [Candidatus Angelobacter sp.]